MDIREVFTELMAACMVGQPNHRMKNHASLPMATVGRRRKLKGWEKENRRKRNRWARRN